MAYLFEISDRESQTVHTVGYHQGGLIPNHKRKKKWLPLLAPPKVCKVHTPHSVSRSLPWSPGKPCAQSGWLFAEDAAFMSSSTNPIMSYPWVTLLAPTSPSLRLRGPSFIRSHSCFPDLFVHARSNGISIVHPDLQLKSVTHTLISFVCICGRGYIRGWRLQDNLRCHFLGDVHLFVETGSHWSRTLLAG